MMGLATGAAARDKLRRLGHAPVARRPGRGGENLYRRADVEHAIAHAPGRGARTDLHRDRGDTDDTAAD